MSDAFDKLDPGLSGIISGDSSKFDPWDMTGDQAREQAREHQAKLAAQAREDLLKLYPASQENLQRGFQSALDVFGQSVPQQLSTFQQGNVGAQNALLAGLPQFQNAILGGQVDLSGMQPQAIQYDTSFAQQQLPQFTTSTQALNPEPVQSPLAGRFRGGRFGRGGRR